MLSLQFDIPTIILCSCAVVCAVTILLIMMPRLRRLHAKCNSDEADTSMEPCPAASVIVVADGDGANLATLLPQLLAQDYPAPYEVIVVQTDESLTANNVVSRLQSRHSNLYMTFVPEGSRNLSRPKLAITLGAKAAQNEVLVLVRGNCRVGSAQWLAHMCRHFNRRCDLVLGYSYPAIVMEDGSIARITGPGTRRESFEGTREALEWLSPAIAGKAPLRGDGANLAYRRELFFSNNGFWSSLNLVNGDDDVFVAEIASLGHTGVELSPEAMVARMLGPSPADELRDNRASRLVTRPRLRRSPRLVLASVTWMAWIGSLTAIAGALCGLPSLIPAGAMVLAGSACWIPLMVSWPRTARLLGFRKTRLTLPWWLMTRPLRGFSLRRIRRQRRDFTWQSL